MLKVLELFGGIGACTSALKRLDVDFKVVDYVEIDKYAVKSYNAMNNTDYKPQDIQQWDKNIDVDLIMHGSPCQDFSITGNNLGGDKDSGTRSSLMYETLRIVEKLKPKYIIWENVKNLLSKKHKHNFDNYLDYMKFLGYTNYYQILNAKDYGVPQNRERVFCISILGEHELYIFPKPLELEMRLKDLLDDDVDEKFYLSKEQTDKIKLSTFNTERARIQTKEWCDALLARDYKGPKCARVGGIFDKDGKTHQSGSIYDKEQLAPALDTMQGGWRQPSVVIGASRGRNPKNPSDRTVGVPTEQRLEINKQGTSNTITTVQKDNYVVEPMGTLTAHNSSKFGPGYMDGVSKTLKANKHDISVVYNNFRIRKLTPLECWRLMGFKDYEFHKAEKVNSNTQLYKQAGNSIVVDVLESILGALIKKEEINEF